MKVIEACVMPSGWTGIIEAWGGTQPPEYITESLAMVGSIDRLYAAPNSHVWVKHGDEHFMVQRGFISWARIIDIDS